MKYIIKLDKNITSFYTNSSWYDRVIRNGKETIFMKRESKLTNI